MGMTIDEARENLEMYEVGYNGNAYIDHPYEGIEKEMAESLEVAIDTMRKYQMMQADHKADMVAMLTDILLEAEKNTVRWYVGRVDGKSDDVVLMEVLTEIIQQKIDKLKEQTE